MTNKASGLLHFTSGDAAAGLALEVSDMHSLSRERDGYVTVGSKSDKSPSHLPPGEILSWFENRKGHVDLHGAHVSYFYVARSQVLGARAMAHDPPEEVLAIHGV